MTGSSTVGAQANWGTICTPSQTNVPGALREHSLAIDGLNRLLLFGGDTAQTGNSALSNAVWGYNTANNTWTWLSGSNTLNQLGNYGSLLTPAPTNIPGSRHDHTAIVDGQYMYVFAGEGKSANPTTGFLNDHWQYDIPGAGVFKQDGETTSLAQAQDAASSLQAYPNPFSRSITLMPSVSGDYTVYNAMGQQVSSGVVTAGQAVQIGEALAPGMYILRSGTSALRLLKTE